MEEKINYTTKQIVEIVEDLCTQEEKDAFFQSASQDKRLLDKYSKIKNKHIFDALPYTALIQKERLNIKKYFNYIVRLAAILFVPLSLYLSYNEFYSNSSNNNSIINIEPKVQTEAMLSYSTNNGVKGYIDLPDGSKVWLNSGSTFEFPAEFNSQNRITTLSGEGYFNIKSDNDWPFIIKTPKGISAKITGTEFNLSCYSNDNDLRVMLISGNLTLEEDATNKSMEVKPMQEIIIKDRINNYENISAVRKKANVEYSTAWKKGRLKFESSPLDEIVKRLERWYGVEVLIKFPNDNKIHSIKTSSTLKRLSNNPNIHFTAEFYSESIQEVLETLKTTSNILYSIDNNIVILKLSI